MPLPRVMKPRIGSPGMGWQHFAKRTRRSPTPLTRTPPVRARQRRRDLGQDGFVGIVGHAEAHDDLLGADGAVADGGVEVVERVELVGLGHLGDLLGADALERRAGQAAQLAVEVLAPVDDVLVALLALEPLADLLAGVAGAHDLEPVARRAVGALGGHDLDDVAGLEPVVERHEPVVDLGPDRPVTDVGVDAIGEVERRGAGGQVLDGALGREDEDLVLEDVELEALHELGRVGDLALPLHELADPGQLGVVVAVTLAGRTVLVAPVGGDADLGDPMHGVGPDLDLERLAVERDDRRVQALVEVALGHRDVIVELAGDRPPERVDHAQRGVAVLELVDEDAQGVDVVDLVEVGALALHLLPDAVDVLGAPGQLGLDAGGLKGVGQDALGPLDVRLACLAAGLELGGEATVRLALRAP